MNLLAAQNLTNLTTARNQQLNRITTKTSIVLQMKFLNTSKNLPVNTEAQVIVGNVAERRGKVVNIIVRVKVVVVKV